MKTNSHGWAPTTVDLVRVSLSPKKSDADRAFVSTRVFILFFPIILQDAASPRYIFTALQKAARAVFHPDDDQLLKYLDDDGLSIEPE